MVRKAFTLIELLVVIVIIGILAAISVATFSSYQEKARMARAQNFANQMEKTIMADIDNISAIWKSVDGVFTDFSQNGNNAYYAGSMSGSSDVPFGSGESISLEPSLYLTSPINMPQESFSISAWFNMDFGVGTPTAGVYPFLMGGGATANGHYGIYIDYSSNPDGIMQGILSNGTYHGQTYTPGYSLAEGKWHHVAATYDGQTKIHKMYLDGILVGEEDRTSTAPTGTLRQNQAIILRPTSGQFDGKVYNVMLSKAAHDF